MMCYKYIFRFCPVQSLWFSFVSFLFFPLWLVFLTKISASNVSTHFYCELCVWGEISCAHLQVAFSLHLSIPSTFTSQWNFPRRRKWASWALMICFHDFQNVKWEPEPNALIPAGPLLLFHILSSLLWGGHAMQHMGSQFPDQGLNPYSLHWKCGVLATGTPGKSLISSLLPLDICFSNSLQLSSLTSPVFLLHCPIQIQPPFWNFVWFQ